MKTDLHRRRSSRRAQQDNVVSHVRPTSALVLLAEQQILAPDQRRLRRIKRLRRWFSLETLVLLICAATVGMQLVLAVLRFR